MDRFDLVVVGAGSAGLVAALIAAAAGARVALVERSRTGGDCLWTGCVPSKALIAAAATAHTVEHAGRLGIAAGRPEVDWDAVMGFVRGAQRRLEPHDSPERLRREGIEVLFGQAALDASGDVHVEGRRLRSRRVLLATGSEPALPPVAGLADADPLTSDTVWSLERRPDRLLIVGGGPIGCELGQAFGRLGCEVSIVEQAGRLLAEEEPSASALVRERLEQEGVTVLTEARVDRVSGRADGAGEAIVLTRGGERRPAFDRVLVATGRRPRTQGLGLEAAGVRLDAEGAVQVDDRLRTTNPRIFAAGDVTGRLPFTHAAAYQARIATPNALFGLRRRASYDAIPWVTFTDPEVARVGLTEDEARRRWGTRVGVTEQDYAGLDRAVAAGRAYGFAKLVADPRGRLVGATVAAPDGGETLAELVAAVRGGRRVDDISQTVHPYPTLGEGPARAADEHLRRRLMTPRVRGAARLALSVLRAGDRLGGLVR